MAAPTQPRIVAIAGPNGAGKSTFAQRVVSGMGLQDFVNADVIARGLSALHPEGVAIEAGRVMLARLKQLALQRTSFAFETTLSGRTYAPWISDLRGSGYAFHLLFVTLMNPELAIERVKFRVVMGGHHIPADDVRRRFFRGIHNFFDLYEPLADRWEVYDNSSPEMQAVLVAKGERQSPPDIVQLDSWSNFCRHHNDAP